MDEKEFSKKLTELKKQAQRNGMCLRIEEIAQAFPALKDNEEQMKHLTDYFQQANIAVGEQEEIQTYLSMEDQNYLDTYLRNLENLEKLDACELEKTICLAKLQDEKAQIKLLNHFLLEVVSLAKLYAGQGVLLEDLIGEGNLALTQAVFQLGCLEKTTNVLEQTEGYIGKQMMDAMERLINSEFKEKQADEQMAQKVNRVSDAAKELSEELRRKVTPAELCENSELTLDEIYEAMRLCGKRIADIEDGEE